MSRVSSGRCSGSLLQADFARHVLEDVVCFAAGILLVQLDTSTSQADAQLGDARSVGGRLRHAASNVAGTKAAARCCAVLELRACSWKTPYNVLHGCG